MDYEDQPTYQPGDVATAPIVGPEPTVGEFLSKEAILGADDIPVETVRVPEWDRKGGPQAWIRIRGLTGKERDRYETSITTGKGRDQTINARNARAKLLVMAIIDGEGKRMFSEEDINALGNKSASALERLFDVARKLSGLTVQDIETLTEGFD